MIYQPASSYYDGQAGNVLWKQKKVLKLSNCITKVYVQRKGRLLWMIEHKGL
jgi:ATP-dependent Clp protease protease subunit